MFWYCVAMARKLVVTVAQVPVDIVDEEVVVGLEVDVVVGAAEVGGRLEVLSEGVLDEVMLVSDDKEDSDALDVEVELLESDEVVWTAELEVLDATSLLEDP